MSLKTTLNIRDLMYKVLLTGNGFEVEVSWGTQYEQVHISPEAKSQMALLPVVKIS